MNKNPFKLVEKEIQFHSMQLSIVLRVQYVVFSYVGFK